MDLKVGDLVRTSDGQTGTVSVICRDSIYINVKSNTGNYIQVLHISQVTKVEVPERPTA